MRKSKLVYRVCWIKSDTGGKDYGRNNHSNHGVKEEARLHDWAVQIEAQQASGMTVQKWCEENGINPKTYYYHLRKLREKCVASAPAIVPLAVPKQTDGIHIEKNGLQISLPVDMPAETLIALVHELC